MENTHEPKPRCWRKDDESLHLSYEIPRRIHVAKTYPVRAANGSTILVYGHEKGLTFLWMGGKPFKQSKKETSGSSTGRSSERGDAVDDDVVMINDEGEEQSQPKRATTLDDFEAVEDISDPSLLGLPIIDGFDILLNASVLQLAFAPLTPRLKAQTMVHGYSDPDFPQIFAQDIVLTAVCSDSSVHLFTVPLMPSQSRPQASKWRTRASQNYQDIVISAPETRLSLRKIPTAVSMTWTADLVGSDASSPAPTSQGHTDTRSRRPPAAGRRSSTEATERTWTLLLATTTSEASGLLRIYAISTHCKRPCSAIETGSLYLLREEHLPALTRTISFKPTTYPSRSHTQLLVADVKGAVRLYDPLHGSRSFPRHIESNAARGQWLLSLYCPFEQPIARMASAGGSEPRTQTLDAAWAMSGTCVFLLLANGSWGLWDIEGSGPNSQGGLLQGTFASVGSISGAGSTPFALRGSIAKKPSSKQESLVGESTIGGEVKKLAPMTPNTRRAKQEHLFAQQAHKTSTSSGTTHGGISVVPNWINDEAFDDSVMLWYNADVYPIPSLRTYWQNAATRTSAKIGDRPGSAVTGTPYGASILTLPYFSSGGEAITNISQVVPPTEEVGRSPQILCNELVVSAEHRYVVIQPAKKHTVNRVEDELNKLFTAPRDPKPRAHGLDRELLTRGELDLGGMNRMLNGMSASRTGAANDVLSAPSQRRVGFAAGY